MPLAMDSGMTSRTAQATAKVDRAGVDPAQRDRLVGAADRRSRSRSTTSLIQPTVSWPVSTVAATRRHSDAAAAGQGGGGGERDRHAPAVGTGWQASTSENAGPRCFRNLMGRSIDQEPHDIGGFRTPASGPPWHARPDPGTHMDLRSVKPRFGL